MYMRDMGPRDRSIRNIPVPATHRRTPEPREVFADDAPKPRRKRSGSWFWWALFLILILCAGGGYAFSTFFAGATVTVYPRTAAVSPPSTITAAPNAPAGTLSYQVMSITQSASTSVPATGSKQVSLEASGPITIYNTYSSASQRLIANTRFEAPDGKIYRIHDSVVVPGGTKKSDGTYDAGTATAVLYADSPGADFNRGTTKFTIPGFKGDPRYNNFYAQADKITGGFVGNQPAVAQTDLDNAQKQLEQNLQTSAGSALTSEIPDGFIAIPGSFQVTYSDIAQTAQGNNSATLSESITASGSIIRASDLAAAIARTTVQGYGGEAVNFADIKQISLGVGTSSKAVGPIQITLAGNPTLVWQFDPGALKQAIVGKKKSDFESIVDTFKPAITKAEAKIRPFWQSTFPTDPAKIIITPVVQ
jgi:hypothetical protein